MRSVPDEEPLVVKSEMNDDGDDDDDDDEEEHVLPEVPPAHRSEPVTSMHHGSSSGQVSPSPSASRINRDSQSSSKEHDHTVMESDDVFDDLFSSGSSVPFADSIDIFSNPFPDVSFPHFQNDDDDALFGSASNGGTNNNGQNNIAPFSDW